MGMIGRRNRSPLWLERATGQGRVGMSMGDGRTGGKLKGLKEERGGRACFMHTVTASAL